MRKRRLKKAYYGFRRVPDMLFTEHDQDGIARALQACGYSHVGRSQMANHWSRVFEPSENWTDFCEYLIGLLNEDDYDGPTNVELRQVFPRIRTSSGEVHLTRAHIFDDEYHPHSTLTDDQKLFIQAAATEYGARRVEEDTITVNLDPTPAEVAHLYSVLCRLDESNPVELFEMMTTWRRT